jgi:protein TonB
MKRHFILLVLFSLSVQAFSQDTITMFFNENWRKVKQPHKANYFRKIYKDSNIWQVKDFYLDSTLQMEGSYSNRRCTKKEGEFKYYYETGRIKSEGEYIKNKKDGDWINYYNNGNKDTESSYISGKSNGDWIWYYENGNISARENYKNGSRVKAIFWDQNGQQIDSSKAEYNASFQGGNVNEFGKWVSERIVYPNAAISLGKTGKLVIKFSIDKNGEVQDVKVIKSSNILLDSEAIRVVKSSPAWKPAKQHNREVKQNFLIPIVFKLE